MWTKTTSTSQYCPLCGRMDVDGPQGARWQESNPIGSYRFCSEHQTLAGAIETRSDQMRLARAAALDSAHEYTSAYITLGDRNGIWHKIFLKGEPEKNEPLSSDETR